MIRRMSFVLALAILGSIALVPSVAAGGGCYAPPDVELSTGSTAHIAECAFQPTVTYVDPGEKLSWTNKDPYDHTVTGAAASWGSDAPIAQGETVTYTFEDEGVYPYYCAYHPSMVGAVVVGDATKAAALTGGVASVDKGVQDASGSSKEVPATPASSRANVTAIALFALLALAVVLIWRSATAKRRSETATQAP